jgi:hypothetical protein
MAKNIIDHQFLKKDYFFPYWEIDALVLGTFNPSCGEKTDYFYGRCRNNFWRAIEELFELDYMYFQNDLERKLEFMRNNKFGCTDVIRFINKSDTVNEQKICGSGYSDQILFNGKNCSITYQFDEIRTFLLHIKVKRIITTWGKRNGPSQFKSHLNELSKFCEQNEILFIRNCPSPSGRLRGKKHKDELLKFYNDNLFNISV